MVDDLKEALLDSEKPEDGQEFDGETDFRVTGFRE